MAGPKVDLIIKLGGSGITVKDELERTKPEEIRRAVEIVARCHNQGVSCIVVHGAGSFGHHHAKAYGVNEGYENKSPSQEARIKEGFCKTRQSVTKLNHLLTEEFVAGRLPAVAVSPCSHWVTEGGKVIKDDVESISCLLSAGFIPLLHGDCVLDKTKGCHILSGDTIIQVLSYKLQASRVVFLSDVEGIYDKPPHIPGAKLIPEITVNAKGNIGIPVETSKHPKDVSGGIQLKLASAVAIVMESKGSRKVHICDINSEAAISACLRGDLCGNPGTLIVYRES